jgi:hypothetical protein
MPERAGQKNAQRNKWGSFEDFTVRKSRLFPMRHKAGARNGEEIFRY